MLSPTILKAGNSLDIFVAIVSDCSWSDSDPGSLLVLDKDEKLGAETEPCEETELDEQG